MVSLRRTNLLKSLSKICFFLCNIYENCLLFGALCSLSSSDLWMFDICTDKYVVDRQWLLQSESRLSCPQSLVNPNQTRGSSKVHYVHISLLCLGGLYQASQNLTIIFWTIPLKSVFWNCLTKFCEIWHWSKLFSHNFAQKRIKLSLFSFLCNIVYMFFVNLNFTWKMRSFEINNVIVR